MKITLNIWVFLVIVGIIAIQMFAAAKLITERKRLADNFEAFATGIRYGQTTDSLQTAKTDKLVLDTEEIKTYFPKVVDNMKQLQLKVKQLERYSAVSLSSGYQLENRVKDTVHIKETVIQDRIIRDTVRIQYIQYKNAWIDFQQAIVADSAYTAIQTRDSISIIQSWERTKRFWFIRYGRKKHTQTVTNANPHSKITYSIFIEKH